MSVKSIYLFITRYGRRSEFRFYVNGTPLRNTHMYSTLDGGRHGRLAYRTRVPAARQLILNLKQGDIVTVDQVLCFRRESLFLYP